MANRKKPQNKNIPILVYSFTSVLATRNLATIVFTANRVKADYELISTAPGTNSDRSFRAVLNVLNYDFQPRTLIIAVALKTFAIHCVVETCKQFLALGHNISVGVRQIM
ncbi:hypothetical protein L596_030479 [Steinernema carpocapsae]|uniref:Uncharacterized protein n=1 Tax=Steinernema carpocapsae TaxID=34508 RepID=A0A4U5LPJ2_STECR|nr:hypothetical protein L596_030479 [Steinernema carpocapsae]